MERWLKSKPYTLSFSEEQIDVENGILRDVVMVQAGEAKGHGVHIEASTVEKIVKYDNRHYKKNGLKARFGHPALSDTTMGTQMGYFHNFRYDEGKAYADLHLLDAADASPSKPNMKSWMLQMAQEASDFVMSSIVFRPSGYYQYDPETGDRVDFKSEWDAPHSKEKIYVDFNTRLGAQHFYTDMVESGAATDALFSTQFNSDKFAVRTINWLRENHDILSFVQQNPHKIIEMCEQLNIPIMDAKKKNLFTAFKEFFGAETPEEAAQLQKETPTEETETAAPAEEEPIEVDISAQLSALTDQLTELQQERDDLLSRVTELEKKPAAQPVSLEEEAAPADDSERYMCPTTLKAMGKR